MTARADFSAAFSAAFSGSKGNLTISGTDPITAGIHGGVGDLWVDTSVLPHPLYQWIDHDRRWLLIGTFQAAPDRTSSYRLKAAALLLAVRWYKLPDAPLGLVGGYDVSLSYVGRIGKDIEEMLLGYRGIGVPLGQEWPTIVDLKQRVQVTGAREDGALTMALEASIEAIVEFVNGPPGVG